MRFPLWALLIALLPHSASAVDFGVHVGGHFGYGKMGDSSDGASQDRDMGTFDLQAMPGVRFLDRLLLGGLMLDYRFNSQLSENGSLSPYGGRSFLLGPGISVEVALVKFLFSYDMRARHYYSNPDTTLKGSGFHFLFGYKVTGNIYVDLEYVFARYNALNRGGEDTRLGDQSIKHSNYGLGLSWSY